MKHAGTIETYEVFYEAGIFGSPTMVVIQNGEGRPAMAGTLDKVAKAQTEGFGRIRRKAARLVYQALGSQH